MKKFLSLVLALVMTMSLVTVAGAAFTDADEVNYDEAVDVISALGVVGGYADGSFNPEGTLTRGAAAKIICNILVGPETAATLVANAAPFADVPANHTFAGYIAYCVNEGIISGYADGTFRPAATLTGYAFMKMLLGAIGYNSDAYTGTNWAINVAQDVVKADLDDGLEGKFNGNKALTREEACLYAFNALNAYTASYSEGSKVIVGGIEVVTNAGNVVLNNGKNGNPEELLRDKLFADLELIPEDEDALGRPAHSWEYDDEEIGTYADKATLVLENYMDADDLADALEDADLTLAEGVSLTTKNGKTIELFDTNEDEIITAKEVVAIEASLVKVGKVQGDKVSTKDKDDRYLTFNTKVVTADKDVTKGTEIDNFEAVFEAADEDDVEYFLVIFGEKGEVFSVEIPEIVEATITRSKAKELVADGETYLTNEKWATSKDDVKLTVGANGVVYAVDYEGEEAESVIVYLDTMLETSKDKWGKPTYTAQIVNEEYEIVEVVTADDYTKLEGEFCTYELDEDDKYVLEKATEADELYTKTDVAIEDDDNKLAAKKYFADDMVVVYIDGEADELEVTVKNGAQNITEEKIWYVMADEDVAVIYVKGEYDSGVSEDVIFVADGDSVSDVRDLDGGVAYEYEVYVDGVKESIMLKTEKTEKVGFYTYTIDEDTGVYTLVKDEGKYGVVYAESENEDGEVVNNGGTVVITKDKYVSVDKVFEDATVTGEIIDLTEEGLYTLADIADWDGKDLKVSFIYDGDENEITAMYVQFA